MLAKIAEELKSRGIATQLSTTYKHNTVSPVLLVNTGQTATPSISAEVLAGIGADNLPISEAADAVMDFVNSCSFENPFDLNDTDSLLASLRLDVCKADWNQEMLADTPHKLLPNTDIAVYARLIAGQQSCRLTNMLANQIARTFYEIFDIACENSERAGWRIRTLFEALGLEPIEEMCSPYLIIDTPDSHCGASVMALDDAMDDVCSTFNTDKIWIIPSSHYEVLALPCTGRTNGTDLRQIICEVNDMIVKTQDQLSDHAYLYRFGSGYEKEVIGDA